jgi:hypothetical protein
MRSTGAVAAPGATANLGPAAEPDFRFSAQTPARGYLGSQHATTGRSPCPFLRNPSGKRPNHRSAESPLPRRGGGQNQSLEQALGGVERVPAFPGVR